MTITPLLLGYPPRSLQTDLPLCPIGCSRI
jgi:hypothetical protein